MYGTLIQIHKYYPMLHTFTEGPFFQPDSDDEEEYMDFNCDDSVIFKDQSYFADQKMEILDEKIQNKSHALKAIRESRTVEDSKVGLGEYNSGLLCIMLLFPFENALEKMKYM